MHWLKLIFIPLFLACRSAGTAAAARYGNAMDDRLLTRRISFALVSIFLAFVAIAAFIRLSFDVELHLPQIIRIHATHFKWFGVEFLFAAMAGFVAGLYSSGPAALRRRLYITTAALFVIFVLFEHFYTRPIYGLCRDTVKDGFIIQTFQSTCGPSALANLFILNGEKVSESEAARAARTRYTGTSGDELAIAAASLVPGFYAHYFKLGFDKIEKLGLPCVLSLGEEHFVTYIGKRKHLLEFVDPSIGICMAKRDELIRQWDGKALFIYNRDFAFDMERGKSDPRIVEIKKALDIIDRATISGSYDSTYDDTLEARLTKFVETNGASGMGATSVNPYVNLLVFTKAYPAKNADHRENR